MPDRFSMLDEYPGNAQRFQHARDKLKDRLRELRATTRYAM